MGRISSTCFLLITIISGAWGVCYPSCDNSSGTLVEGSKVPNPFDCTTFYVCSDVDGDGTLETSDSPISCPEGTYFDPSYTTCLSIPTDGSSYCTACNPCEVVCTEDELGAPLPDPYDCSSYFVCLAGGSLAHVDCGPDEGFDYLQSECVGVDNARCFESCDPCGIYCTEEGRVPNPSDCHSYLYCEPGVGTASFTCPADMHYDANSEECVEGEECDNQCSGSGNTNVPTTQATTSPTGPSNSSLSAGNDFKEYST
jgi:hypothetical protein